MFDMEKAIVEWRIAQAALPAAVLDELEEHLRSGAEALAASGLSADEAFLVARHRLGAPTQLDSEFEKVPTAYVERRLRWMLAGVVAAAIVPGAMGLVAQGVVLASVALGVPETVLPGLAVACGALAFALAWRWIVRLPAGARDGLVAFVEGDPPGKRSRWKLGALILGAFVVVHVSRMTLTMGLFHMLTPSVVGSVAIANSYLAALTSLTLLVASVYFLARRRPAGAHSDSSTGDSPTPIAR